MAQIFGQESLYLRKQRNRNSTLSLIIFFCFALFFSSYFAFYLKLKSGGLFFFVSLILVPLCFVFLIFIIKYSSISNQFSRKIRGEKETLVELEKLPFEYLVFYDVKFEGIRRNVDFVVVGPSGIYSIETKFRKGEFDIKRLHGSDFIEQASGGAKRLYAYLREATGKEYPINPVLVFSRARAKFGLEPVGEVYVINKRFIEKLIAKDYVSLPDEDIELIRKALIDKVGVKPIQE